jgi:cell wall assembly regulator SMI1
MPAGTIAERWARFAEHLGIGTAGFLRPPATEGQLHRAEEHLGYPLPADLRELLSVHDGGYLLDGHEWLGCAEGADSPLVGSTRALGPFIAEQLLVEQQLDLVPGTRTLWIAAAPQLGILYDLDEQPGRLLYLDVLCRPAVIPLCRDLATLLDCYIELAGSGYMSVEPLNPRVATDPILATRDIYLRHGVADVRFGLEAWLDRTDVDP